ncbi:MAG: hypothetical protein FD181_2409 [Prolixibacteraceae bacterium]|nr:MAG: hypothetical protein FD181_2409 [Prolixibacteraceae bacterium]
MIKKTNKNRFFDILETKKFTNQGLYYCIEKQIDKTINGLKPHFQKNKD